MTGISLLVAYFFVWIEISWWASIPLLVLILFGIANLGGVGTVSKQQFKNYGAVMSRGLIVLGLFVLLLHQGLVRYYAMSIIVLINIALYVSSYQWDYSEGKGTFFIGILISFGVVVSYLMISAHYHPIAWVVTLAWFIVLGLLYAMNYLFDDLPDDEHRQLIQLRELALYVCCGIVLFWLFQPYYHTIIVAQIAFITLCIGVRQTYLGRKKELTHNKKIGLNGRALLAGQKVLERYDEQNKSFDLHLFNFLIQQWYMPSRYGMRFLQHAQLWLIIGLVALSVWGLFHDFPQVLLWYWLGIFCFIITLFAIPNQEKFISYYKTIALGIITGSYYITLFDTTGTTSFFTRGSLAWLCCNMIICLFYNDLFPESRYLFNKDELLFWLVMIILGSVITIISLVFLPLQWSFLFALWCIIIGIVSYFSYHIWKKVQHI